MKTRYDVIVVGAGGSGLAAALTAAEQRGRVLVLEKRPRPGGTTSLAVGSFTAAGTALQEEAGIEDAWQQHAEDLGQFAPEEVESRNNDPLRRFFLSHAADSLAWLQSLGLQFVGPHPEPPNRVPRMHNVVPAGRAYVAAMQLAAIRAGVDLYCGAEVTELAQEGDRVVGLRAVVEGVEHRFVADRGVIMATGDYSNSAQHLRRHKGEAFGAIEGINPHSTGDGHRLIDEVGGQLVNMDVTYGPELRFVSQHRGPLPWFPARGPIASWAGWLAPKIPSFIMRAFLKRLLVTWQHPEDSLFADGAILVNHQGKRFVNEKESPQRELEVARQTKKEAFLLMDGSLVRRYSSWPNFVSTAPDIAYAYVSDYQRLRKDITTTGYKLNDVALRKGLDAPTLQQTVAEYNDYTRGERDDSYGRRGDQSPLTTDPWVLIGPLKAYFTTTEGGAAVDEQLRVLDHQGKPIAGLFAVGMTGSGGLILWSHGLHIAWAITSGRLAGAAAMRDGG